MTEIVYEPDLRVGSLFARGWAVFKEHLGITLAVFIIYSLLTGSTQMWNSNELFDIGEFIMFVIAGPVTAGTYMFALKLVRGSEPDIGEMLKGFPEFGRAMGVFVLYTVMVIVGMVFLVVPGIYIAVALMPAMFLVLDDDLGVIDTLQKAWAMTDGHRGRVFLVLLSIVGLNVLGLAAFIIGVLFSGALSLLIGAALYDELSKAYVG